MSPGLAGWGSDDSAVLAGQGAGENAQSGGHVHVLVTNFAAGAL
jgi:hypothetical protein